MKLSILWMIGCAAFLSHQAQAEDSTRHRDPRVSITLALGMESFNTSRLSFTGGLESTVRPGIAGRFAVKYGPILQFAGIQISPELSLSLSERRARATTATATFRYALQRVPLMVSLEAIAQTRFSPFVRVGLGTARTDFLYDTPSAPTSSFRFHDWQQCWELTGGINYSLSSSLEVTFSITGFEVITDLTGENGEGREMWLPGSSSLGSTSIGFTYSP
jgi:opacity protein-like surface antigen